MKKKARGIQAARALATALIAMAPFGAALAESGDYVSPGLGTAIVLFLQRLFS